MAPTPAHFLVKSEPYKYSFAQLCRDGETRWDGVRSFEARNNLRAMRVGDLLLFYHSNEGKEVVGVARVTAAAYPDPTAPGEDWSVVDLAPVVALTRPVTLATIKAEPRLAAINLLRRSRLSVVPVTATEFALLLHLGDTKLPAASAPPPRAPALLPPENPASPPPKKAPAKKAAPKSPSPKKSTPKSPKLKKSTPKSSSQPKAPPKSASPKSPAPKSPAPQKAAPQSPPARVAASKLRPTAATKLRTAAL